MRQKFQSHGGEISQNRIVKQINLNLYSMAKPRCPHEIKLLHCLVLFNRTFTGAPSIYVCPKCLVWFLRVRRKNRERKVAPLTSS